jgi:hypothetical protein
MPHDSKSKCPLCALPSERYLFARHGVPVLRCTNCGFTRLGGALPESDAPAPPPTSTEQRAAAAYVAAYLSRAGTASGVLAVVPPGHPVLAAAENAGIGIDARHDLREIERGEIEGKQFTGAVVVGEIERTADPIAALQRLHQALTPEALLLLVAPSLDSWPARTLRSQWTEWRPTNRSYFDTQTIQSACLRAGFAELEWTADRRVYTLEHLHGRAARAIPSRLTRAIGAIAPFVPAPVRRRIQVPLPGSAVIVTARRVEPPPRPRLSVVMPVYNEVATVERTLEAVLAKELDGVDKEVIVVESASTDGTRQAVQRYERHPAVRVIYEDRPRGKGAAVRTGLAHARGNLVLIQDADSEYDVNDYDALLEPILTMQCAFVLGSRHVGSWKVRRFADEPLAAAFFNAGHVLFGGALNLLYRQSIQDPFTMYKVFRRDCLHGLRFECNRFDFDFELVIKLLRKGYVPLEVPVNYQSRSFKDGKKVTTIRDPLTWIRALLKYRVVSIYEPRPASPRQPSGLAHTPGARSTSPFADT